MRVENGFIILKDEEIGRVTFDGKFLGIMLILDKTSKKKANVFVKLISLKNTFSIKSEYLFKFELKPNVVSCRQFKEMILHQLKKNCPEIIDEGRPAIAITEGLKKLLIQ